MNSEKRKIHTSSMKRRFDIITLAGLYFLPIKITNPARKNTITSQDSKLVFLWYFIKLLSLSSFKLEKNSIKRIKLISLKNFDVSKSLFTICTIYRNLQNGTHIFIKINDHFNVYTHVNYIIFDFA